MNFWTLFFPFPSIIRLWLGGFFNFFFFNFRCAVVLFYSVSYSVEAERNSELSVFADVGVVLCFFVLFVFGLAYFDFSFFKCVRLGRNNFLCSGLHHFAY